jgi:hypothetical protein
LASVAENVQSTKSSPYSQFSRYSTEKPSASQSHTSEVKVATTVKGLWSYTPGPLAVALVVVKDTPGA